MLGFENWKTPCKVKSENLVSLPLNSAASSSETQGQIKGARESLNGWGIKYGTKKSKERREEPLGQCLTRLVPNGRRRSGFWLVPGNLCFSGTKQKPKRRRPFGTGLVRHSARLDFPSSPLSAPGSPRMARRVIWPLRDWRARLDSLYIKTRTRRAWKGFW